MFDAWVGSSNAKFGGLGGRTLNLDFTTSQTLDPRIVFSRASTATDLMYTASSGTYNSFASNTPRLFSNGLLMEGQRTQFLGASDSPATQTTSSLSTGKYCYWVIGSGSAAVTAGTATITGGGSAVQGTYKTFTVTAAGTVTITVTGTLLRFQLEGGTFPSSYIPNSGAAGTSVTRAGETSIISTTKFAYRQTQGSITANFVPGPGVNIGDGSVPAREVFSLEKSDGSANNIVALAGDLQSPNHCGFTFTSGGTFYLNNAGSVASALVEGQSHKAAIAWNVTNVQYVDTGGTVQSVSITAPQAATSFQIGGRSGNQQLFGYISQLAYWQRKLSSAQLLDYVA